MPKQFRREIDTGSPAFICTAYPIAALTVILIFRLIYPNLSFGSAASDLGGTRVLSVFRISNSLTRGLLDFIMFFPAIFMSAQLIPFGHIHRLNKIA